LKKIFPSPVCFVQFLNRNRGDGIFHKKPVLLLRVPFSAGSSISGKSAFTVGVKMRKNGFLCLQKQGFGVILQGVKPECICVFR
jgi:hypothetical protein